MALSSLNSDGNSLPISLSQPLLYYMSPQGSQKAPGIIKQLLGNIYAQNSTHFSHLPSITLPSLFHSSPTNHLWFLHDCLRAFAPAAITLLLPHLCMAHPLTSLRLLLPDHHHLPLSLSAPPQFYFSWHGSLSTVSTVDPFTVSPRCRGSALKNQDCVLFPAVSPTKIVPDTGVLLNEKKKQPLGFPLWKGEPLMLSYGLENVTQAPWGLTMGRGDEALRTNPEDSYAMVQCEGTERHRGGDGDMFHIPPFPQFSKDTRRTLCEARSGTWTAQGMASPLRELQPCSADSGLVWVPICKTKQ